MKVALPTLLNLLKENVVEIKFTRRRPRPGDGPTRRMLCTNANGILNTKQGAELLNYTPANSAKRKFDPKSKNLAVTWDIFMQDYRCVNVNSCEVLSIIPQNDFWQYYNEQLLPMTADQKISFMNS